MSDTSKLTSLGGKSTKFPHSPTKAKKPEPGRLETFTNPHPATTYLVPFIQSRDEFTSLCPKTGQPDHAKLEIIYVPNDLMVESKTLKEYLVTFRNHGEFHEDCMNRIAKDLYKLMSPKYLRVYGDFAPRGSLAIKPMVEWWNSITTDKEVFAITRLVDAWDTKN